MNAITFGIIALAGFATFAAAAYRIWVQPGVCAHFGEEFPSRRDRQASGRRRSFERRCGYVLLCLYGSIVAGTIRLILTERWSDLAGYFLFAQIGAVVVAGLFLFTAWSRWMQPLED